MRKKINKEFVDAVRQAIENLGGQSELSRQSDVPQGTISAIINPKRSREFVLSDVFNKLLPFVSPYMEGASTVMKKVENSGNIAVGSNNNFLHRGRCQPVTSPRKFFSKQWQPCLQRKRQGF